MEGVRKLLQVRDAGAYMELGAVVGFWMHLGSRAYRICCGLDVGEETGIVMTPASVCMVVSSPGEGRAREDHVLFVDVEFEKRVSCQGRV